MIKNDIQVITSDIQEIKDTLILLFHSFNDFEKEVNIRFDRIESCPTIKKNS